jgi:hypothetical protein
VAFSRLRPIASASDRAPATPFGAKISLVHFLAVESFDYEDIATTDGKDFTFSGDKARHVGLHPLSDLGAFAEAVKRMEGAAGFAYINRGFFEDELLMMTKAVTNFWRAWPMLLAIAWFCDVWAKVCASTFWAAWMSLTACARPAGGYWSFLKKDVIDEIR